MIRTLRRGTLDRSRIFFGKQKVWSILVVFYRRVTTPSVRYHPFLFFPFRKKLAETRKILLELLVVKPSLVRRRLLFMLFEGLWLLKFATEEVI